MGVPPGGGIPVHAAQKTVDYRAEVPLHSLNSTYFKIKILTINILFL